MMKVMKYIVPGSKMALSKVVIDDVGQVESVIYNHSVVIHKGHHSDTLLHIPLWPRLLYERVIRKKHGVSKYNSGVSIFLCVL